MHTRSLNRRSMLAASAASIASCAIAVPHSLGRDDQHKAQEKSRPSPAEIARIRLLTAPSDVVRTVPLKSATPVHGLAATKHLTYYNGPLLPAVEVAVIFWGSAWQQSPLQATVGQLNDFFDFILTSSLIDQLAEYSAGGMTIGHGRRTGSTTITSPAPPSTLPDSAAQDFLKQQISAGQLPQPNANTLYFLYLPPGVTLTMGGGSSCVNYCGYHYDINGTIYYALMPYLDCDPCLGGLTTFNALTLVSSHELCEAITDPVPGAGWYDFGSNAEIGDLCAWKAKQVGAYTVQQEWSNQANTCV